MTRKREWTSVQGLGWGVPWEPELRRIAPETRDKILDAILEAAKEDLTH